MSLTEEQLSHYQEMGFLLVRNYLSPTELEILLAQIPQVFAEDSPRRILEKNGEVRSVFASHITNEAFRRLSRLPQFVDPAMQILGSDVYVHQFKINAKVALKGDQWEWHQDFLYWHKEDGMPAPRVLTAVLFLQEVNDFNGPILVIPGSHREGMIETIPHQSCSAGKTATGNLNGHIPSWAATLTSDLKYKIDKHVLARLVGERNIRAITGAAGSVLFFHGNLFHASPNNLSPWDRVCVFITYNSVENIPAEIKNPRPEYIACRDFSPIVAISRDALFDIRMEAVGSCGEK
jgi:L-proline 4-hydroxylase